jgi:hypothetical protein
MPLPDEDFPVHNHDLGVPWQVVVARMDLVRIAVVVERLQVDGADGRPVSDVLLRNGAFCRVGQYLRAVAVVSHDIGYTSSSNVSCCRTMTSGADGCQWPAVV